MPTKTPNSNNFKSVAVFCHDKNKDALAWAKKIKNWLQKKYPAIKVVEKKPEMVIVLGGDGTILEAAKTYQKNPKTNGPVILGLNLGKVGFLASIRDEKKFLTGLEKFFKGSCEINERMMLEANVKRGNKVVHRSTALNDVIIQNLMNVAEIEVNIEHHPIQYIRGSGVLVATATGSTAYNLSAHGPIVMPSIKCFVITEILDHDIPTPSIVLESTEKIKIKIIDFRSRGFFSITKTKKPVGMVLSADGQKPFPLKKGDVIWIKESPHKTRFADLEEQYFFKSLHEKFAFK